MSIFYLFVFTLKSSLQPLFHEFEFSFFIASYFIFRKIISLKKPKM